MANWLVSPTSFALVALCFLEYPCNSLWSGLTSWSMSALEMTNTSCDNKSATEWIEVGPCFHPVFFSLSNQRVQMTDNVRKYWCHKFNSSFWHQCLCLDQVERKKCFTPARATYSFVILSVIQKISWHICSDHDLWQKRLSGQGFSFHSWKKVAEFCMAVGVFPHLECKDLGYSSTSTVSHSLLELEKDWWKGLPL